ncbi:MAG: hypothetical protein ACXVPQ_13415 [Bacteroidia bacterium]
MKKAIVLFLISCCVSGFSQTLSFQKKSVVIDLNANLGIYNTTSQDSTSRAQGKPKHDKGAPYGFALGVEYGVLDWLGIGLKGQTISYISTTKDSATGLTPSIKANDIALVVNAHLVRKKKFDLVFGGNIGYSHMTFRANDTQSGVAKGGGVTYDLHLIPRLYFGKHFGMYFSLSYAGYSYGKLSLSDKDRQYTDKIKLTASGVNYALGFQVMFGGN